VKPAEAARLLKLLRAAYPDAKQKVSQDTADLWLAELRRLDAGLGETAVRSLLASSRFWPSLAELQEQVEIARRQAAQARRERERREADEQAEALPRPPLEEISGAQTWIDGRDDAFGLPRAEAGECQQCHRNVKARFVLGRFTLCRECTRSRKAVAVLLATPAPKPDSRPAGPTVPTPAAPAGGRRTTCRLCRTELQPYEQPEGVCDGCLRAHRQTPTFRGEAT
jgi:hypothetical protein